MVLLASVVALAVAAFFGLRPVTNPGVQACGSPAVFAIRNDDDVTLPSPGSPDEPANAAQLRAQPRCHALVDEQLGHLYLALGIGIGIGLVGAGIGLLDDRLAYRRAPRFESYLVERPADVPGDPWDQPVVPVTDLGERVPEVEWREVRVVTGMGLLALVALPLLAPWSVVRTALGQVSYGWVALAVALVALSYPLAAAGLVAATGGEPEDAGGFDVVLQTTVAASYTGKLLPEYGSTGLAVHQLVRAGVARRAATRRVRSLEAVAMASHALLLVVTALAVGVVGRVAGAPMRFGAAVAAFVGVLLVIGVATAPRRYRNLVVRPDRRTPGELRALLDRPLPVVGMVGSCLGQALVEALVVVAAVHAFGGTAPFAAVLFASLVATVAAVLAATPDGAGVVEAALVLGLIWAGVDAGPAVAAALLARVVSFWVPMVPGWFALRRLERAEVL